MKNVKKKKKNMIRKVGEKEKNSSCNNLTRKQLDTIWRERKP